MKDDKDGAAPEAENIRVAVRCRPMNERELREQAASCFVAENGNAVLTNLDNPAERHEFGFDHVYGIDTPQVQVFKDIGAPILDRAFGGYNGTIFAYGQTGSGKTFSMTGVRGSDELEGLIPRMNRAIFERIQREKHEDPNKLFLVECSFFEIYNEIIYDLLDSSGNSKKNKGGLEIKEHAVLGIYVKDLQERVVESREEVIELMQQGQNARTVGYTQMNAESSRSHSIFIIKIHQKDSNDESKNIFAKINLVDLAGSERAASTGAQGDRLKEGANINKSLSALGNVINALVEASRIGKKVFIPYRNSKLTRVLQESLGGNSLCSMLATLSPANINFVETLSTLKYASRAKSIKVNAKKNEASSQISQLNEEIATLKKKLMEQTSATLGLDPKEKEEIVKKYEQQIKEMDRVRLQTWEDKAKLSKQHELERKRLAKEKALADQKIREERTRKWKLLEEKGDVELMLRALRDLDRNPTSSAGVSGSSATVEDNWLAKAQAMKSLETEAKDLRTMIMVFKDSVDKDVEQWAKRLVRHDSTTTAAARRDDTAATHMIVNQLCSKLQNVFDESTQLLQMEKKLVEDGRELINEMMSALFNFKEQRRLASKPKISTATASSINQAAQKAKDDEQILDEREKGLGMTLSLIQRQRAKLVNTIRSERLRIFNLTKVCNHFMKYIDSFTSAFKSVGDSNVDKVDANNSLEKWSRTGDSLAKASEVWEAEWSKTKKQEESAAADSIPVTYVPKGEVAAVGLEAKLINDECLYSSSRKPDARLLRMNAPQFWIPDDQDPVPFAVIDLGFPRFVHSLAIRGGNTAGSPPIATSSSPENSGELTEKGSSPILNTTFQLRPTNELIEATKKYKLDDISGDHESTYDILSHVLSWHDLLKTNLVPIKLFARPPIRFLHDVISAVIHNTGYAKGLFSPTERDYTNLPSKTERADYLTKILDYVQDGYRRLGEETGTPSVIIAATASNILAGKEPTDTLKFLCYFALAALDWTIKNPPATKSNQQTNNDAPAEPGQQETTADVDSERPVTADGNQTSPGRSGWVKKIRISTSLTGKPWRVIGDFDANTDEYSLSTITFPEGTNAVGRFVQLTCMEWHEVPLFQVEVYGQEASESDELVKVIEVAGTRASQVLRQLHCSAGLFAEEARASWEKAKDAEREKQEELIKLVAEITRQKQANAEFEREIKELQQSKSILQQNVRAESKKLLDEKAKAEKLQVELQQTVASLSDANNEKEALSVKLNEQTHVIQTNTLQLSEQRKEIESLQQSKTGLKELCATLRTQLQAKSQEEGHQESKLASVMSDLMAVNVQLEEAKRRYETSEQMRKEQEQVSQQMHTQLQSQLSQATEKERTTHKQLQDKITEVNRTLEAVQSEKDDLRRRLDDSIANETASKATNDALKVQMNALQDDLEAWKRKAAEAQERCSPTKEAIQAASAAASAAAAAQVTEQLILEAQTKELRCMAEMEKMEIKMQSCEQKQREAETKLVEVEAERDSLSRRITELEEQEEELQLQLQVVTEERDAARLKEEQLFVESNEKDQEIERIRDGYDRMNSKEDELAELQEQLEKYQALLQITSTSAKKKDGDGDASYLFKLYTLATGQNDHATKRPDEVMNELSRWIEQARVTRTNPPSTATATATIGPTTAPSKAPPQLPSYDTKVQPSSTSDSKVVQEAKKHDAPKEASSTAVAINITRANSSPAKETEANNQERNPQRKDSSRVDSSELKESEAEPLAIKHSDSKKGNTDTVMTAPTKPSTPRHPTSARKASASTAPTSAGTSGSPVDPPANLPNTKRGDGDGTSVEITDDGYDDDFDADEPDGEHKKQFRRKSAATKV